MVLLGVVSQNNFLILDPIADDFLVLEHPLNVSLFVRRLRIWHLYGVDLDQI